MKVCISIAFFMGTAAWELVNSLGSKDYNIYGSAVSKQSFGVWKVKLDMLPMNDNIVLVSRDHIVMVFPGSDERKFDREQKNAEDIAEICATSKRKTQSQFVSESIAAFVSMDKASIQTAKSFTYRHGPKSIDTVEWTILEDDKAIDKCDMGEYAKKEKREM